MHIFDGASLKLTKIYDVLGTYLNGHQNLSRRYASSSNIWKPLVAEGEGFETCYH